MGKQNRDQPSAILLHFEKIQEDSRAFESLLLSCGGRRREETAIGFLNSILRAGESRRVLGVTQPDTENRDNHTRVAMKFDKIENAGRDVRSVLWGFEGFQKR
jgi:hypothetical protein